MIVVINVKKSNSRGLTGSVQGKIKKIFCPWHFHSVLSGISGTCTWNLTEPLCFSKKIFSGIRLASGPASTLDFLAAGSSGAMTGGAACTSGRTNGGGCIGGGIPGNEYHKSINDNL